MVTQCNHVAVVGIALFLCYVVQITSSKMLQQNEFLFYKSAEIYDVMHDSGQFFLH